MTITLSPEQEEAVRAAIRAGQIASVEEFIECALAELQKGGKHLAMSPVGPSIFDQRFGLFGDPEDTKLIDDIVAIAYQERRRVPE